MDLFSQLPDYNQPEPIAKKNNISAKKEANAESKKSYALPEKGEAIILEDVVSMFYKKDGAPLIYAKSGEVCKIFGSSDGPLVVLINKAGTKFHAKAKKLIINK